jgi:hypothetical protein
MRALSMIALFILGAGCGGNKAEWLVGQWLLLDADGKPGVCHEFKKEGLLVVYTSAECGGDKDQASSGRYDLKAEDKLGIIRYNERKGQLVLITEKKPDKKPDQFGCRGGISGTMYKIGPKGSSELLAELDQKGLIKVKPLDPALGCRQIALPLKDIRSLPKATTEDIRMLRHKDQALQFHVNKSSADPRVEKTIYALNDESLEWMALHLADPAFNPPGPQTLLENSIGKPLDQIATGKGTKRQHIVMWKSYCALTRDAPKSEIDVTLFATTGKKRGTIYVSNNVVAGLWEELKQMAQNPENEAGPEDQDEEEEAAPAKADTKKAAPEKKAAPAPKAKGKEKPAKKSGGSDDDDI